MTASSTGTRIGNIALIVLLVIVLVYSAIHENLFNKISPNLWMALAGGTLLCLWLCMTISVRRLAALIFTIFAVEYVKESIGVDLDLFHYATPTGYSVFGVWMWALAALTTYTVAVKAVMRLTRMSSITVSRALSPLLILVVFLVIPFTLQDYWPLVGPCTDAGEGPEIVRLIGQWMSGIVCSQNAFWVFYAIMFAIGIVASLCMDMRTLVGLLIAVFILSTISEHVGTGSGIWTFHPTSDSPHGPPFWLLFGAWPLEFLAQYAISGWIAGESLNDPPSFRGPAQDGGPGVKTVELDGPSGDSSPDTARPRAEDSNSGHGCAEPPGPPLTREERILKYFMLFSFVTYLIVGLLFALLPVWVIGLISDIADIIFGSVHPAFLTYMQSDQRFWVSMTFSMMMTISALSLLAFYNIRRNKIFIVPLLIAKFSSAASGLLYFVFGQRYFANLVIFAVDGVIFWITLKLLLDASRGFFAANTVFLRQRLQNYNVTPKTKVAVLKGDNKLKLLDDVLEATDFNTILKAAIAKSNKAPEDFAVAIKPNFMFTHSKRDVSTYTDPELVEHLVNLIAEEGITDIAIVEAQATLGNYYANRDVLSVAEHVGYSTEKNYRIVDLTEEMEPYDYGGRLGKHWAGPAWRDADFRISFAKNKTHTFCNYTLTIKNVYGTLPCADKLKVYHTEREYDWPTIESMKHFPVHFGLVDAFVSADGQFGVMCDPYPNHTKTILGGKNPIAIDYVGAKKMGIDPWDAQKGRFFYLAVKEFGFPEDIEIQGDCSLYDPWDNVSDVIIKSLDLIEEAYHFSNWGFSILSACDKAFPLKITDPSVLFLRWVLSPIRRYYYRYDVM
jgi:uncharacterized protein (DUF362 family)